MGGLEPASAASLLDKIVCFPELVLVMLDRVHFAREPSLADRGSLPVGKNELFRLALDRCCIVDINEGVADGFIWRNHTRVAQVVDPGRLELA